MFYHASPTANIKILEPRISNHNIPLIYFSDKRENVLVYLSNAVEKFCKETNFDYSGTWHKWASYGFDETGKLQFEEYYPNALIDTYNNVSGFIYSADSIASSEPSIGIPNAFASREPVPVNNCEYIENAYTEILKAEKDGLIVIKRYEDLSAQKLDWINSTMKNEYQNASGHPEYRYFIREKFGISI